MNEIDALLLGLVQGLTEFLPVSSSGHLAIGNALLGTTGDDNLMFAVLVHAATVMSTIVVLRKEIVALFSALFRFQWDEETKYIVKLLISMIPVGIVGLFFKDYIEEIFGGGLLIVGCMLLLTAALLAFAYYARPRQKEKITFLDALIIGIGQACAVMPGLSRSGTTIATGILLGNKKESVAKFSFLMVLAPVLGEVLLDIMKGNMAEATATIPVSAMIVGFLAAFLAGAFACKFMIEFVKRGKLIWFSIYCTIASLIAIVYSLIG